MSREEKRIQKQLAVLAQKLQEARRSQEIHQKAIARLWKRQLKLLEQKQKLWPLTAQELGEMALREFPRARAR